MPVMVCWSVGLWFDPWQGLQSGAECSSDGGGVQRRKASDCWLVGRLVGCWMWFGHCAMIAPSVKQTGINNTQHRAV